MLRNLWRTLRGRKPTCPGGVARRLSSYYPRVEALELRLAPAAHIWTGASGIDLNWNTDSNWQGNNKPVVGEAGPVDLNFPAVAPGLKNTVDNLPGGPLQIDHIN